MDDTLRNRIIEEVERGLGVFGTNDTLILSQVESHIAAAVHFLGEVKGLSDSLLGSESGILLITIFVNDVWRNGGKLEFSPATDIMFNGLMDEAARLRHQEEGGNG